MILEVGKAHQRIIREKRKGLGSGTLFEFLDDKPVLDIKFAKIREIDTNTAKHIIKTYEWLGTMSATTSRTFGLYIGNIILGVVCFSLTRAGGNYSLYNKPAICLSRGANIHYAPKNSSSFLIQNALKLLKIENPTYVIAYSDFDSGEIGQVYQSCGWYYLGQFQSIQWVSPDGKRYDMSHHRNLARKEDENFAITKKMNPQIVKGVKKMLKQQGWKIKKGTMRGRYATIIGNNSKEKRIMLKLLKDNKKPYPKRTKKGMLLLESFFEKDLNT